MDKPEINGTGNQGSTTDMTESQQPQADGIHNQQQTQQTPPPQQGGAPIGWAILCFFIPIVGLILFLVWRNEKPRAAKWSGIGGIIGVVVSIIMSVALFSFGLMASFIANDNLATDSSSQTETEIPSDTGSATEGDYLGFIVDVSTGLQESLSEFSTLNLDAGEDPTLMTQNQWKEDVGAEAGKIKAYCDQIIDRTDVPDEYADVQAAYSKGAKIYKEAMDLYTEGVDSLDADKIMEASELMTDGATEFANAASLFAQVETE